MIWMFYKFANKIYNSIKWFYERRFRREHPHWIFFDADEFPQNDAAPAG